MSVYRGCTYTYTGNAMSILDCNVLNLSVNGTFDLNNSMLTCDV